MSKFREVITYGKCRSLIDALVMKDQCQHFIAAGEEGSPEAFFCHGCGCHLCCHEKIVEKEIDISNAKVIYGECVKNHAARNGGRWVDGCGEFVAAGEEGTPEAFTCAACHCHRSFHTKEYL